MYLKIFIMKKYLVLCFLLVGLSSFGQDVATPLSVTISGNYPVVIDYHQSLAEMIQAGRYDQVHTDITSKNFPADTLTSYPTLTFIYFSWSVSTDEVTKEMSRLRYRPATLVELLALGVNYPDLQKNFKIVALGSSWTTRASHFSPYLWQEAGQRILKLDYADLNWEVGVRFLAVHK